MTCHESEEERRAQMEVERLLAIELPVRVSEGFNDAVMRRIHATSVRRVLTALVEVVAEPIVPFSVVLIVIVAWEFPTLPNTAALALAPFLFWISWRLFRTYERLTLPHG